MKIWEGKSWLSRYYLRSNCLVDKI